MEETMEENTVKEKQEDVTLEKEVIVIEDEQSMEHDGEEESTQKSEDGTNGEDSQEDEDDQKEDPNDPYAYAKREEFTSENFKIELRGLPRYYSVGQLKKLMNDTLQLKAHKIKPAGHGKNWVYINFRDQKARERALVVLEGYQWKKCTFTVSNAKPVPDPLVKHEEEVAKKKEEVDPDAALSIEEKVVKSVTPYAHLPYDEQLKMKQKEALQVLRKYGTELARVNPELVEWVHWQKLRRGGQICEVDDIAPSPVTDGYRNKCEFTIGINPDNNLPTVGFRIASYKEGSMHVGPVNHLCHLPDQMKKVVMEFEKFVRDSGLAPFSPQTHEGVWRQLNVRTTRNKDILIAPMIHPQDMSREEQAELKKKIVEHFTEGPGKPLGITSIFFKAYGQKEQGDDDELEHLWGEEYITETILEKNFRVSPDAFLQVNTAAAEVLYNKIGTVADLDGTCALLDICCGTGTIGISLADRCYKVYGVEVVDKAADDARFNAEENGLENIVVINGKAEENMQVMTQNCSKVNVVGIVDPPRAGLNGNVVFGLRKCDNMKHLVFVSCDPSVATKNFINLGRPQSKQYKGEFFIPMKAIPVDLFPHTPHYELIILFERWEERKWRRIMEGNPLPRDVEYFNRVPKRPRPSLDIAPPQVEPENTGYGEWKSVTREKPDNRRQGNQRYQPYPLPNVRYNQGFDQEYDEPGCPEFGHVKDYNHARGQGPNQDYGDGPNQDYGPGSHEDYGLGPSPDYGRRSNIEYGRRSGIEYGRRSDIDYGRRSDIGYGRRSDIEYGRRSDLDYGRGFYEGRGLGFDEGRGPVLSRGRDLEFEGGRGLGADRGRGLVVDEDRGLVLDRGRDIGFDEGRGMRFDEGRGMGFEEGRGMRYAEGRGLGFDEDRGLEFDERRGLGLDERRGLGLDRSRGLGIDGDRGLGLDKNRGLGFEKVRGLGFDEERRLGFDEERRLGFGQGPSQDLGPSYRRGYADVRDQHYKEGFGENRRQKFREDDYYRY